MALGDSGKRILAALRRLPGSFLFLFYCLVFVHPLFDDTMPGLKVHPTTIHGVGAINTSNAILPARSAGLSQVSGRSLPLRFSKPS